jgi:energy-coupling factor transporter ATP-binding protein EcfA2
MIRSIQLRNFKSFGPNSTPIHLKALNVCIGPNGSGKSNFLDAFRFLSQIPQGVQHTLDGVPEHLLKRSASSEPSEIHIFAEHGGERLEFHTRWAPDVTSIRRTVFLKERICVEGELGGCHEMANRSILKEQDFPEVENYLRAIESNVLLDCGEGPIIDDTSQLQEMNSYLAKFLGGAELREGERIRRYRRASLWEDGVQKSFPSRGTRRFLGLCGRGCCCGIQGRFRFWILAVVMRGLSGRYSRTRGYGRTRELMRLRQVYRRLGKN